METEKYTTVNISHQYVHALRPCLRLRLLGAYLSGSNSEVIFASQDSHRLPPLPTLFGPFLRATVFVTVFVICNIILCYFNIYF